MTDPRDSPPASADFEHTPLTRNEYITAMVHMYRGEMSRANTWRMRLDTTTNWSVVSLGVALSISFATPDASAMCPAS